MVSLATFREGLSAIGNSICIDPAIRNFQLVCKARFPHFFVEIVKLSQARGVPKQEQSVEFQLAKSGYFVGAVGERINLKLDRRIGISEVQPIERAILTTLNGCSRAPA